MEKIKKKVDFIGKVFENMKNFIFFMEKIKKKVDFIRKKLTL